MIYSFTIGFLDIRWVDILDVLFVSILLFQVYKLIRGSIAIKVFLGFLSLYLLFVLVRAANMELLTNILGQFMGVGVLAVIIIFQQEIRKFLLLLGRTTVFDDKNLIRNLRFWTNSSFKRMEIGPIIDGMKSLSGTSTGALMVISRNSELKFYADSGDRMDSLISKRLLISIFNKYSPLHDGAIIIYNGRIVAARCILPVTERDNIPANLGLRHRAAIGMSEATDVLVIIVSEETGQMSTCRNGEIQTNLSVSELREAVYNYLYEEKEKVEPVTEEIQKEEPA